MSRTAVVAALVLAYAFGAYAADDDSFKIHVYGWSYGRERKTITSSNRVTADFQIKNVSTENLNDVTITLVYTTGLAEKIDKQPPVKKIGALKAGESQKVKIVGDFIPVFGGYEITVQYNDTKKEEWNSSQDVGQPQPKNGEPLHGVASVLVIGKEVTPDKSGKFAGAVRVKNEGTVEAKNVKISITFYDTKKQKIVDWSGKLGDGTLAGGAEENIPFVCPKAPRLFGGYEIKVGCDDTSAEAALSGGDFTTAEEVEFAKFAFKRADPKSPDLTVTAQVRNGFKVAVDKASLTMVFYNAKKKELKSFTHEVSGQLKAGEIKPVEFTISGLPNYDSFEQKVGYNKIAAPGAPKETTTKITAGAFQNLKDIEIIFTDSNNNEDKSVSLAGAARNGKSSPVKDIAITVTFTKADGSVLTTAEKTLSDVMKPGEERNFVMKAPGAAGFASYSFKFKYVELKNAATTAAKVDEAGDANK